MEYKRKSFGKNYLLYFENSENNIFSCDEIVDSWNEVVNYVKEDSANSKRGLREAQLGAIFAIQAHWTVSDKIATIVMPTGTGKTETIITTILAKQFKKVFILVPSDLLRTQTSDVCVKLGILKEIGIVEERAKHPNVLCLKSQPKDKEALAEMISNANIIISTASLIGSFTNEKIGLIRSMCDVLIIDEAHHIEAKRWNGIRSHFKEKPILQFTATPFRNDGKKIDGEIIYNYPLSRAQKNGYFKEINFKPIMEFDEQRGDFEIAKAAVKQLELDCENGLNHLLLVRAKTIRRAKHLFENIYSKEFASFNPVLIISEMNKSEKKKNLELLKTGDSRIVVCVDMFGEGIDIPNLKIAAIHDRYKSLPITLQFIGRFARSKPGLGAATVVTNLANEDLQSAVADLYAVDSDWNILLSKLSETQIEAELALQKLSKGFIGSGINSININQLNPALSMIAYRVRSNNWKWENWKKVFDEDFCRYYFNEEEKILIIVEAEISPIEWANYRETTNLNWNLHLAYWNEETQVLFLNSTNKSVCNKFAEAMFDNANRIQGEEVFKCLYGINHLMVANLGLNSAIDGPIRYKMFTGIDIAEAISESQKGNCIKSNIFGRGYNGNGKTSIGCSYKGTIWGRLVEPINVWKEWCDDNYRKISNPGINTSDILRGVLTPIVIKERPKVHAYRIDWPNELDLCCEACVYIESDQVDFPIYECQINLVGTGDEEDLCFNVSNASLSEEFRLTISNDGYKIKKNKGDALDIRIKNKKSSLVEFLNQYPPDIKFVDQSSLQGNLYITLNSNNFSFKPEQIITWKWENVNIKNESQGCMKDVTSIQYHTIHNLSDEDYDIIFDDDNPGEIADIVAIKELDDKIHFEFYHCKYSHGENAGARIADLYEVCGQAEKSVLWKHDMRSVITRMISRETSRLSLNGVSRFEKGSLAELSRLKNKLRFVPATLDIYIVQPGVAAEKITEDMHQLLCGTQAYLMDTYGITLRMICSE